MNKSIGAGTAKLAGLQIDLLQKYRDGQLTLGQIERFLHLSKERRETLLRGGSARSADPLPPGSIILPRSVHVDRSKPLADMIRETGCDNLDWSLANITEADFPVDRSGLIQGHLVYEKDLILLAPYEEGVTTKQWWDWMDDHDLIREGAPELAAFGRDYPEVWLQNYIVAFASSCLSSDGALHSPVLWSREGGRKFYRFWFSTGGQWRGHGRALVSRRRLARP